MRYNGFDCVTADEAKGGMTLHDRSVKTLLFCILLCCVSSFALWGCTRRDTVNRSSVGTTAVSGEAYSVSQDASGDAKMAVVCSADADAGTMSFKDLESGWTDVCAYDSDTVFTSRYGERITPDQIETGDLVDYSKRTADGRLAAVDISYDSWEFEDVTGLRYDASAGKIYVHGDAYDYSDSTLVIHDGTSLNRGDLALSAIDSCDRVTCRGYKGRIFSVTLESGHGYVRLSDYTTYLGGMLEIGGVVSPVTENMLLTVPVGTWTLEIDKDGQMGTRDVVVSLEQEQTVNLANLTIIAERKGVFHFNLEPAQSTVMIDGTEYPGRNEVMVPFGKHRVVVSAVGYKSYNGTIDLKSAYMNVNVQLEPLDSDSASSADAGRRSSTSSASTTERRRTTENPETTVPAPETEAIPDDEPETSGDETGAAAVTTG